MFSEKTCIATRRTEPKGQLELRKYVRSLLLRPLSQRLWGQMPKKGLKKTPMNTQKLDTATPAGASEVLKVDRDDLDVLEVYFFQQMPRILPNLSHFL